MSRPIKLVLRPGHAAVSVWAEGEVVAGAGAMWHGHDFVHYWGDWRGRTWMGWARVTGGRVLVADVGPWQVGVSRRGGRITGIELR